MILGFKILPKSSKTPIWMTFIYHPTRLQISWYVIVRYKYVFIKLFVFFLQPTYSVPSPTLYHTVEHSAVWKFQSMAWCDFPIFALGPEPMPNPYAVITNLGCATFIKKPLLFHYRYSSILAISSLIQTTVLILAKGTRSDENRVLAELSLSNTTQGEKGLLNQGH